MRQGILVVLLALGLTACAGTDAPTDFSGTGGNGDGVTPGPTPPAQAFSAIGSPATILIKNVTVGQIRRIATGDGTPAIGSADLIITCTITGVDSVECAAIPGVPQ